MATKKVSLTYNDYVRGIQALKPEDQLSLVEIISAGLKKTLMKKRAKHRITGTTRMLLPKRTPHPVWQRPAPLFARHICLRQLACGYIAKGMVKSKIH